MDRRQTLDLLLFRTWWTPGAGGVPWIDRSYQAFNLFEGVAWLILSALVLARYLRHRHSRLELAYALAFFTFGLTDFREAFSLQSWLIWAKLANLLALFRLRQIVIRRHYPASRLY